MKKTMIFFLPFAFAAASLFGAVFSADRTQDAYDAYGRKAAPLERQLYAKQAELDAVYASPQPDTAKAQQLFREIGELKGQLFAAWAELHAQLGESDAPYAGMPHSGRFGRHGYGYPDRGGYRGHRGGGQCAGGYGGYDGDFIRHGGGHHHG
ncbi:MAG: hypothetical protein LBE84_10655 [Planctomycetota bacterium]|nr:hypothetical protein [Planctomycetota bacterium]